LRECKKFKKQHVAHAEQHLQQKVQQQLYVHRVLQAKITINIAAAVADTNLFFSPFFILSMDQIFIGTYS
jgi:hypothetical protein